MFGFEESNDTFKLQKNTFYKSIQFITTLKHEHCVKVNTHTSGVSTNNENELQNKIQ